MAAAEHLQAISPAAGRPELRPQVLAGLDRQSSRLTAELLRSPGFWIVLDNGQPVWLD
jgi:hypothetical protein